MPPGLVETGRKAYPVHRLHNRPCRSRAFGLNHPVVLQNLHRHDLRARLNRLRGGDSLAGDDAGAKMVLGTIKHDLEMARGVVSRKVVGRQQREEITRVLPVGNPAVTRRQKAHGLQILYDHFHNSISAIRHRGLSREPHRQPRAFPTPAPVLSRLSECAEALENQRPARKIQALKINRPQEPEPRLERL
jgi:hypothetical protein